MSGGGWGGFGLAMLFSLVTHAVPSRPALKARLVGALGRAGYGAAYGGVSLFALGWLIVAARRAPFVPLFGVAPWQLAAPFVLMVPACLLVAFTIGRPNPYSFGGMRNDRFDPAHPGVVRLTRHPLLAAIALWAFAHALANPDLAHVILFGGFVLLSLAGMAMIDRRRRALAPAPAGDARPRAGGGMGALQIAARLCGGLALYLALVGLHPFFAGVPVRGYAEALLQ